MLVFRGIHCRLPAIGESQTHLVWMVVVQAGHNIATVAQSWEEVLERHHSPLTAHFCLTAFRDQQEKSLPIKQWHTLLLPGEPWEPGDKNSPFLSQPFSPENKNILQFKVPFYLAYIGSNALKGMKLQKAGLWFLNPQSLSRQTRSCTHHVSPVQAIWLNHSQNKLTCCWRPCTCKMLSAQKQRLLQTQFGSMKCRRCELSPLVSLLLTLGSLLCYFLLQMLLCTNPVL